ncbi:hypothetical protein EPICR_30112 [Candidatus Desulfarcum epimagneticum]|uniref:Uncharacterized protein n=1 Tax=uncultured Desulfobacteraceae bacterium TaxID=218296 RepID=A0A484HFZ0_9BACT|nr:hypothetical protein EPICR_30112 [uncultured Desulfobacteraceae bacterium]
MKKTENVKKNKNVPDDISELYRAALKHYIEMYNKKKFRSDLFKKLNLKYTNISFSNLNNFINEKTPLSEKKRIQIAYFLGFRYEDFIYLGRKLVYLKENNIIPQEAESEDFYLNRATGKIFKEIQEKHSLTDRDVAGYLSVDLIEYQFKKKGLIPFSFDEIAIVFKKTGRSLPDMNEFMEKPPEKKKIISQIVDEVKKMSPEDREVIKKLLETSDEIGDKFVEKMKRVKKMIKTDDNV